MKIRSHNSTAESQDPHMGHKCGKVTKKGTKKNIMSKQNIDPLKKDNQKNNSKIYITDRHHSHEENPIIPDLASQYYEQIIEYLKSQEESYLVNVNDLKKNLSKKTRTSLIKFYFKVQKNFKLKQLTVHLATYYLDSFMEKNSYMDKNELIIYAQAALWIAMKYEQIYPPQLDQWVSKSKVKAVLQAEAKILYCLNFRLGYYSVQHHLQYMLEHTFKKIKIDNSIKKKLLLLTDLTLFDDSISQYKPMQLLKSIIFSLYDPKKIDERMEMNIKWMIQRNQSSLEWLQLHKYQKITEF